MTGAARHRIAWCSNSPMRWGSTATGSIISPVVFPKTYATRSFPKSRWRRRWSPSGGAPKGQGPELMVKYVPDRTGRFSQRPHYEPKELDRECENIIAGFLKERHGVAKYPVSTDDLTVLIERDTESL